MPARVVVVIVDSMTQILTIVNLKEMTQDDAKCGVYLTKLGVVQIYIYIYIYIYIMWNNILVSSELGRIWKDAVVA